MLLTSNERTWLTWLVKARIIVITFVLGIELALVSFTPAVVSGRLFAIAILLWYAVAACSVLLLRFWPDARPQAQLQVLADLVFATIILYATGGIDTSFNVLFPLIIIMAAIMLPRYWAFMTAALSFILFGSVLELCFFGIIPSVSATHTGLKALQAIILVNLFAYMVIAYLASHLAFRLRQVHVQLQEKSGALENLQALHENIVKSMSGGVITTDLDGRITVVNPAGERLLGSGQPELMGMNVARVFSGSPLPVAESALGTELSCRTPSGIQKTFSMRVSPLTAPGQGDVGRVYTFDDLTEIRRLEREVRVRDRMAAIGRMAAGIAHEIRNPLSSIAGSVHVLAEIAPLNDEQRSLVDVVTRESERLNQIIGDFLDYSRAREYHFSTLDLANLLGDTLTLLGNRPEVCDRSARVDVVRDIPSIPAWALVDGDRIKQVFWNLCDNALHAMPQGGTLRVSLRPDGDNWQISFSDTGTGLAPQAFDKIFEPFQSGFARGTGLGLAIVYEIVQAHEGRISVHSALGSGTEFILQLKGKAQGSRLCAAAGAES